MNNRARLPCQKVPHHAHRHFLCGALEISHFLGNNRNLLFKKEIFYGKSSAHTRSTSILLYAEVYRYTFETLQEIPRYRQWFCQKIWDRKHMKSTDRENFPLYCCHFHATNPLSKSKKTAPQKVVIPRKAFPDKNKESLCMVPLKSRCHAWYQTLRAQRPFVCIYEYIHKCVCPISNIAALETNFGMSAPGTCNALTDNPSQIVFPVFPGHKNHNCHKYLPLNKQRKQMTKKEAWWRGTSVRFSPLFSTIRTTSLGQ